MELKSEKITLLHKSTILLIVLNGIEITIGPLFGSYKLLLIVLNGIEIPTQKKGEDCT